MSPALRSTARSAGKPEAEFQRTSAGFRRRLAPARKLPIARPHGRESGTMRARASPAARLQVQKGCCVIGSEVEILAGQYHSNIKSNAMLATVCAFEMRYDLPVVFVSTPKAGARLVERWAFYFARQTVETVNSLWNASASGLAIP